MERGDIHFSIFAIMVGAFFFFMMSGMSYESGHTVSENISISDNSDYHSFCTLYSNDEREEDDHEYNGYCQVYSDDVVFISGVVVGIEYLGENSIKYNINSTNFKSMEAGDKIDYNFNDGKKFILTLRDILYYKKNEPRSSTIFDYSLSK